jgi:tryptophan synthase beta chain
LDYPGVGPEHSYLKDTGRAEYVAVSDRDAIDGFRLLSRLEGIIPALETAHAVSWIASQKGRWSADEPVLLCVSGRGDKDVAQVSQMNILGS